MADEKARPRPCVPVERYVLGMLENNVYVVDDGDAAMIVDPTCEPDELLEALRGRSLEAIVLTHHHADHMGAAAALREATGAKVVASDVEAPLIENPKKVGTSPLPLPDPCPVDVRVSHGDVVKIGSYAWKALLTPGHSKGSMCLFLVPELGRFADGLPVLLSGDTLFAGTVGRTDFEGGSADDMRASLKRLAALPDETLVLPGHGDTTTIGAERLRTFARWA